MRPLSVPTLFLRRCATLLCLAASCATAADDQPYLGAFKEFLPSVEYSATKTMDMTMGTMKNQIVADVSYIPYKEWSSISIQGMSQKSESLTLFDSGVMYTSIAGMVNKTEMTPMQSISDSNGSIFNYVGNKSIDGIDTQQYDFQHQYVEDGITYDTTGSLYRDDNGLPIRLEMNVAMSDGKTMDMVQQLSNIQIGAQDPARFVEPQATGGLGAMMGAMGQATGSGAAGAGAANPSASPAAGNASADTAGDQPAANQGIDIPEPVEEVSENAKQTTQDSINQEVGRSIRKGIGKLFGN